MKKKFLSMLLVLSMLCAFMPVVSNAAESDVTKLVDYIVGCGSFGSNGNFVVRESSIDNGWSITSLMTYHSPKNTITFALNMEKGDVYCHVGFDYDISTQKAINNKMSANYTSLYSSVIKAAVFDMGTYTQNTLLNFISTSTDMNPPSNINEIFNDTVQAAVSSWGLMCYQKAGVSIDNIGFTSYYSGSTSTPTPTPALSVQYYSGTEIPTYTSVTGRELYRYDTVSDVLIYKYNQNEFAKYLGYLDTHGFIVVNSKTDSDAIYFAYRKNDVTFAVSANSKLNEVAIALPYTSTPTPIPTYTISYDANGGTGAPSSQTVKLGSDITVSSQIPTRKGYDFLGWSTSKTAQTATYTSGASMKLTANKTLYAVWQKTPMPDTTGNKITISNAQMNENIISFTAQLSTTHTMQGTIFMAIYNANNALVDLKSYSAVASKDISFSKQDDYSSVKIFWWYDTDSMYPMADCAALKLDEVQKIYSISKEYDNTHGSVTITENGSEITTAAEGKQITIAISPKSGYGVLSTEVTDASGNIIKTTNNTFTMPNSDVNIRVTFIGTKDSGLFGTNDNLNWLLDDNGTLTISGNGQMQDFTANNAPWNKYKSDIKIVVIKEGVTRISRNAFTDCSILKRVLIDKSITEIEATAFKNCINLNTVEYGGSKSEWNDIYIGTENEPLVNSRYIYNSSLTNTAQTDLDYLKYSKNDDNTISITGCFSDAVKINIPKEIDGLPVTIIGENAFSGCDITSVTIPDSITNIGDYAFSSCDSLTNVIIPDSVTDVGIGAFSFCGGLTSLKLGNNVTTIKELAFSGCSGLANIMIPDSVISIGGEAFYDCNRLASITIGGGVTSIGESAFDGCGELTGVYISDLSKWCGINFADSKANPTHCANKLYVNNELLTELEIPKNITSISSYTFTNCNDLIKITIPNNVKNIGESAFLDCNNLDSVYISDMTSYLNIDFDNDYSHPMYYANKLYLNNRRVTSLEIPNGVTKIPSYAFNGCDSISSIIIPDGVTSIGANAFGGTAYYNNKDNWENDILYINNYLIKVNSEVSTAEIKSGTKTIADKAFYNCSNITDIIIPDSIVNIGINVFENCEKITDIHFNASRVKWNEVFNGDIPEKITLHTVEDVKNLQVGNIAPLTYNGSEITPEVIVKDGVFTLQKDVDYTVSYENNVNAGKMSIIITGTETENSTTHAKYSGKKIIEVEILKPNINIVAEPTAKENLVYNGTEQELINNGNIQGGIVKYSLEESGTYSADIPKATNAGTYTVYYKVFGDENHKDGESGNLVVTISKADLNIITTPTAKENLVYNGSEQELINNGEVQGGIVKYSFEKDGEYSENIPKKKSSGTYTVYYKVFGDENHNDGNSGNVVVTIAKADLTIITVPTAKENLVYNGSEQELINSGEVQGGIIKYSLEENGTYSENIPKSTNVGTYTVYYKILDEENSSNGAVRIDVTIASANPTIVTVPTAKENLAYNGTEQELINKGEVQGGTIKYSLEENGEYSEDIPKKKSSGTYIVYYKVFGDENHTDSDSRSIVVTISKANFSIVTAPTARENLVYNNTEQELINKGEIQGGTIKYSLEENGEYSEDIPKKLNSGTYTIYYKVFDDENYNDGKSNSIIVTIEKATPEYTIPENLIMEKNKPLSELELPNGWEWDNPSIIPNQSSGNSFKAIYIPTDTDNYKIITADIVIKLSWMFDGNGTLTISGEGDMNNYSSTSMPWYNNREDIKSVIIENGITSIGEDAFRNCSGLKSITIPDSVTSIGDYAFWECRSLTSITIPEGVTVIGSMAFSDCSSLETIYYNAQNCTSMGSKNFPVFSDCAVLKEIYIGDNVKKIPAYAFYGCSSLTSVTISDSVTSIGSDAFNDCRGLTGVNISDLASWCNISFYDSCSNPLYYAEKLYVNNELVTDVVIPDNVTTINPYAFCGYSNLTSIIIPNSVTSIGNSAFYRCSGLTSIEIPNSITSIGSDAFGYCVGLTSIKISDGVTNIGDSAFEGCSALTSIIIPDNVTSIGNYAFRNCSKLVTATMPDGVTNIGDSAFEGCKNLLSITIPDKITSIKANTFCDCSKLYKVTIGSGVTSIGNSAFKNCWQLQDVVIPDGVVSIGSSTFSGCSNLHWIIIPKSVTSIGSNAFYECGTGLMTGMEFTIYFKGSENEWKFSKSFNIVYDYVPEE